VSTFGRNAPGRLNFGDTVDSQFDRLDVDELQSLESKVSWGSVGTRGDLMILKGIRDIGQSFSNIGSAGVRSLARRVFRGSLPKGRWSSGLSRL
jgi:hypothetical protein